MPEPETGVAHGLHVTTGATSINTAYAVGAASRIESSRSIRPPWPGSRLLMSLTPRSRLISDSPRSPSTDAPATARPKIAPCHQPAPSIRKCSATALPAAVQKSEPAKPSQDFFGLTDGAIGCLP